MLKPSLRFFIIPLGAICTLASLSAQNATPRARRDTGSFVRQQVAMNLELRHAPHVHFVRDTAEENAARINEILQDLTSKGEFEERSEVEE